MDYSHIGSSWVLMTDSDYPTFEKLNTKPASSTVFSFKKLTIALAKLAAMDSKLDALMIFVTQVRDIMFQITEMKERFDSFKYLLLATHLQMDKVKNFIGEIGADVDHIRLKLDQVIKEIVKIANRVQDNSSTIKTSISKKFEEMSTAITNSLSYFMCLH
ncbi:hypothetical protein RDI58_019831 [Solanum bulbocastanum]|uniref:Uncharacterized protein n=1 Tax=Solanum bulbocastanum TaxID=147425 RepID=A0AAN8Y6Y0_SOLBU